MRYGSAARRKSTGRLGTAVVAAIFSSALLSLLVFIYYSLLSEHFGFSGYDAHRFYLMSFDLSDLDFLPSSEQFLVRIIGRTNLNGFLPSYTIFLSFWLCFLLVFLGYPLKKVSLIFLASPSLSFFLETGKDVLVLCLLVSSLAVLDSGLLLRRSLWGTKFIVLSNLFILACLVFLVKGVTLLVYIPVFLLVAFSDLRSNRVYLVATYVATFFGVYLFRASVDILVIQEQSRFSLPLLVTTSPGLEHLIKSFFRFPVYFLSPAWYFFSFVSLHANNILLMFFHSWSFLLCFIYFFLRKHHSRPEYLFCALVFAFSYPFVHLRYFFVWYFFYCISQWLGMGVFRSPHYFVPAKSRGPTPRYL
jgi:hypothetical protein